MNIRMKFALGVTFLVIQLHSIGATALNQASGRSQIDTRSKCDVRSGDSDRVKANDIIYYIKSRNYKKALEKMQTLQDDDIQSTMNYIIHEAYNNAASNVGIILPFVDSNRNLTTSLAIYEALNFEMNNNNHNDHLLRLKLIKSFNSKPFDPSDAEKLKKELHDFVSNVIAKELKSAVKTKTSATIATLFENIYNNYPELFVEVIKRLVKEAFDEIDRHYLVTFFLTHKHASQRIYAYSAVFEELRKRNSLNQNLVVTLASGLKEALALKNSLDRKSYDEGYRLKGILPTSVRNIAFARIVCIVNKNEEYLYGASDKLYDDDSRYVNTWMPKGKVTQGKWFIERHGDVYRIKNYRNDSHSEYMYARVLGFSNASPTRSVLTWIPGGTKNNSEEFNWTFEPSGPFVFIRYERRKEYLFSGNENRVNRRYVYTDRTKIKVNDSGRSLWMVENCSGTAAFE